ncbi:glycoside hydrolase domain-containing protein, partial [Fulvivirga sp.]
WYIFSALGFYPVCPSVNEYVLGAPLFEKATIQLENGNTIEINAPSNSDDNRYVQKLMIDGQEYAKNYLIHEELMKGAKLDFEMTNTPNKTRGTNKESFPYSFSNQK